MNKNEVFRMISFIDDSFLKEAEEQMIPSTSWNRNLLGIAASILFLIFCGTFFLLHTNTVTTTSTITSGTLPGAETINPSIMYNGKIFYWEKMAGPSNKLPKGNLPAGYEYAGDISYTDTGNLEENFQFTATFEASGQVYYNSDKPSELCLCLTTPWMNNAYVIFSLN